MISLDEMATFVAVVKSGSMSAASRELDVPLSTISRRLQDLEKRLKVQLIQRTTRRQSLTDIGQSYFVHCTQMVEAAEAAELTIQSLQAEPAGTLRIVTTFPPMDRLSSQFFQSLLRKYPSLDLEIDVEQRQINLIEERYDLAIVPGTLKDSSLIARQIGETKYIYAASKEYIEQSGQPSPAKKFGHNLVHYIPPAFLGIPEDPLGEVYDSRIQTNNYLLAYQCVIDGLGFGRLPLMRIRDDINEGRLIRIFPELEVQLPIHLVFPRHKQHTTKLRAVIEHFAETKSARPF